MADNSLQSSLRSLDTLYKTRRAATPTQPWEYEASVNSLLGQNADSALSRARINLEDKTSTDQFNKSLAQAQAIADAEAAQQQKLYDQKMAWEKEQADKTLAQNKAMYDAQMAQNALNLKAQEDAAKTGMISNVGTALAIDYLSSGPGESVVGKVGGAVKDAGTGAYNKLFGPSTPTSTPAPASTPISGTETYWAQNAPDAGGAVTAGLGPELASSGAGMALDVAANTAPEAISLASTAGSPAATGAVDMAAGWGATEGGTAAAEGLGSTLGSTMGSIGAGVSTAAPWAAAGYLGTQVLAPYLENKWYGKDSSNIGAKFLRTVEADEGFGMPQQWAREMGAGETGEYIANYFNPVGSMIEGKWGPVIDTVVGLPVSEARDFDTSDWLGVASGGATKILEGDNDLTTIATGGANKVYQEAKRFWDKIF